MLWCQLPGRSCMTNQMSVADGTPCTMIDSATVGVGPCYLCFEALQYGDHCPLGLH